MILQGIGEGENSMQRLLAQFLLLSGMVFAVGILSSCGMESDKKAVESGFLATECMPESTGTISLEKDLVHRDHGENTLSVWERTDKCYVKIPQGRIPEAGEWKAVYAFDCEEESFCLLHCDGKGRYVINSPGEYRIFLLTEDNELVDISGLISVEHIVS